ncbi:ABC transporter ATP-binding protein [Anoxybacillus flavithermus]|uniref:ATP-binding cassette domain-containing protein n=2 Tax=Anoxybacillus flavithermus TaxID=33934 RepID=UPI0007DA2A3B|nr:MULTISPECIES: ATP-binding cassette domain-containing protein [Anoxybacillus]MCL6586808.1 ATP-binding cassette domain-containing protein [Anoxybacillus sp.]OAO78692.1 ABC transporter ATP-binding protein [Anoxybacillus flavithermus]
MIKINNLSKTIKRKKILDNISAELKGITGIIGPNGAGKTTLMKIIAGVIKADDDSTITYNGKGKDQVKIGFLPQNFNIYPNLTVFDVLKLLAALKDAFDEEYLNDLLNQLNLSDYKNHKMKSLSGGTLQRVGIAQALLNKPNYLVIDEPTTGLDILECIRLRNSLLNISKDVGIIISSHIPEDITSICDHLLIIDKGRKVFEGSVKEMIENSAAVTYEGVIEKSRVSDINTFGTILTYEKYDEDKVKVKFVTQEPFFNPNFNKIQPDFLSGYVSLLKGGM